MPFTVALLHTRLVTVDLLNRELSLHLPNIRKFNILDETLLFEATEKGLTPRVLHRLVQHCTWAEQMKAEAIVNVPTVLEPAVPICQEFVSVPFLRINEPMCELAVREGPRICVLGRLEQPIQAVADLLQEVAERQGRSVQLLTKCVPEAIEQLDMGDLDMHNRLVAGAVRELAGQCDAIVLTHVSLQPLLPVLKREIDVPVFGSAEPIISRLAKMARERHPTPPPHHGEEVQTLLENTLRG